MAKTQDLRPDTVLKNYWNDNERFADIFNAVLFNGEQVIKAEELESGDTEESSVLEHRDYAESIRASRDSIKVSKRSTAYGVELAMLGLESQEHIHYAMPLRVMGYDYGIYKKQYDSNAGKYKNSDGMDEDEYLSRMKKTDKFMPVITIVVYYGEKPWDGAVSLHGMLDIPEGMKKFVNDYKMLLVEARQNDLTFHHINNVDFFNMMEMVLDKNMPKNEAKEKVIKYAREHEVDKAVIMTVAGATNCKIDYNMLDRKGDADMCTLFEEIARDSKAEGKIEGKIEGKAEGIIETGFDCGLSENDILERLQKKLDVSLQVAREYLEKFGKQTV
ncbi:MAG: Rpn family recombination-promoting nuclease/putative transposase [Clostridium sp.]|nr:Rpn family recombination-promoting nuclease/putative transposase [Clostridium sp.]